MHGEEGSKISRQDWVLVERAAGMASIGREFPLRRISGLRNVG